MSKSLEEQIENLISQRSFINSQTYLNKIESMNKIMNKKIKITETKIAKIRKIYQVVKGNMQSEISTIGLDKEWSQFYSALTLRLNEKIYEFENSIKSETELLEFNKEISAKLESQALKLQKLQQYSEKFKQLIETSHKEDSLNRENKMQELKNAYQVILKRLEAEKEINYDEQINLENKETQRLTEQLMELNVKKENLEKKKMELNKTYQEIKNKILNYNATKKKRKQDLKKTILKLATDKKEMEKSILEKRKEINHFKIKMEEMELLLTKSMKILNLIKESNEITLNIVK